MTKIKLILLSEHMLETLRLWRNENRFYFINQEIITPNMQKKWFAQYQKNPNDTVYIVYFESKSVGVISVVKIGDAIKIGRLMLGDKSYKKRGIMGEALEKIITKNKDKKIFLEVLKNNSIAISFYRKNKFKVVEEKDKSLVMERFDEK